VGADSPDSAGKPARLAVFVSGGGTNLQALLDHFNRAESSVARVTLVISNREGIEGLRRAERASVPTVILDPSRVDHAQTVLAVLEEYQVGLIVLAGYLKLVPAVVVERYREAMINIHPALLPAFGGSGMYGRRVHEAVIASGAAVSGATVHLVDDRYDEGRIVAQYPVPVHPGDTPAALAERVLRVEHLLLPAAVEAVLRNGPTRATSSFNAFELVETRAPSPGSIRRLTS
jgi:phosphoribosylglycinamide formyltransferase-1